MPGFALVGFNLFWAKLEKPAIKKQTVKKIIRFMLICFSKQKFAIEKYNNFLLPQGNGLYLQRFLYERGFERFEGSKRFSNPQNYPNHRPGNMLQIGIQYK
jgi:hypothetical protein